MTSGWLKGIRYRMENLNADVSPITDREKLLTHIEALEGKLKVAEEALGNIATDKGDPPEFSAYALAVRTCASEALTKVRGAP